MLNKKFVFKVLRNQSLLKRASSLFTASQNSTLVMSDKFKILGFVEMSIPTMASDFVDENGSGHSISPTFSRSFDLEKLDKNFHKSFDICDQRC